MTRSPIALALVAALGVGTVLPAAPVLAQAASPSMTVSPIRTGQSSIGGTFGVRLSVYDARSFELFWNRIPNAATYRVQVGSRTVQENGATSRFVGGVDVSGGFDYTLTALDRAGTAFATQRFRVQPASGTQLVAVGGGGTSAPTTPSTPAMPTTPANPTTPTAPTTPPAAAATSRPTNLRLTVYSPTAAELFWRPGTFVDRNEIRRDGVLIATLGGGGVSSYFDAGREPGRSYTYEVRAIDGAGPASATIGGTGGTPTTPANPATPANPTTPANPMAPVAPPAAGGPIRTGASTIAGDIPVRLAVYDARSFELFWERVPGAATYRLSRDGQIVQESNGVSRFVTGVNSAASFAYTLVALDRSGTAIRSTRFTVSPSAGTQLALGGSGTAPTSPTTPTAPTAVNNGPIRTGQTSLAGNIAVRLSVYDARVYELFWERVSGAVRYRLSRGGQVVQESDATSFFVGSSDSTQRFDYTLVALDRSGNAVRTARFTVAPRGTPQLAAAGGGASTPTTPTNPATPPTVSGVPAIVTERVAATIRAANGKPLETMAAIGDRIYNGDTARLGFTFQSSRPSDQLAVSFSTLACPRGGTVVSRNASNSSGAQPELTFSACAIGPLTITGALVGQYPTNTADFPNSSYRWTATNYRLADSRDGSVTTMDRGVAQVDPRPAATTTLGSAWSATNLAVERGSNPFRVSSLTSRELQPIPADSGSALPTTGPGNPQPAVGGDGPPPVSGFSTTSSGLSAGRVNGVSVGTFSPLFRQSPDLPYVSGILTISGNGYEYQLDANSGDPATFQVNVAEGGVTAAAYFIPRTGPFLIERFDPAGIDLGF